MRRLSRLDRSSPRRAGVDRLEKGSLISLPGRRGPLPGLPFRSAPIARTMTGFCAVARNSDSVKRRETMADTAAVVIVGAGPSGLVLGNLLRAQGISTLILE